jgi:hypothetical protein
MTSNTRTWIDYYRDTPITIHQSETGTWYTLPDLDVVYYSLAAAQREVDAIKRRATWKR